MIVNFAPTGMIPTKAMTPHVPVSTAEIVDDVLCAVDIGITMVHIHARNRRGKPTHKAKYYRAIVEQVRKYAPELVICVSLSGRFVNDIDKRAEPLQVDGIDMASLTLSSVNFNRQASINEPDTIKALCQRMQELGVKPELEAFDAGMVNYAKYLSRKGLLTAPHYFNLLLGNIACAQADLLHLGVMVRDLPEHSVWCGAGIGDWQLAVNSMAIAAGGGVRVGLEDNIWYDRERTELATNSDLLRRIHILAQANERTVMQPKELRRLLELPKGLL